MCCRRGRAQRGPFRRHAGRQQVPHCFCSRGQALFPAQQLDGKRDVPVAAAHACEAAVTEVALDRRAGQPGDPHALQRKFLEHENQRILEELLRPYLRHAAGNLIVHHATDERGAPVGQVDEGGAGNHRQEVAGLAAPLRRAHRDQGFVADLDRFEFVEGCRSRQRRMAIRERQVGFAAGVALGDFIDPLDRAPAHDGPDFAIEAREQRREDAGRAWGRHQERDRRCGL